MKTRMSHLKSLLLSMLLITVVSLSLSARNAMKETIKSFDVSKVEQKANPQFKQVTDQSASIYDFMRNRLNCPRENSGCILPGTEVIGFVVTSTGELTDFRVISSISGDIDQEMIRILEETSGNWQPGQINGEPVDMDMEVAMAFLPSHYDPVSKAKMYLAKANRLLYEKKNPKRALKYFNAAYRLLPCDENVLIARSLCKFELGDAQGAVQDLKRITALNNSDENLSGIADSGTLSSQLVGY